MINFLRIFANEVKFIVRQGTTSQLIMIYPVLIMLLIGPAFTSSSSSKITIASYGESNLLDKIELDRSIRVIRAGSESEAIELVRSKVAVMALIFDSTPDGNKIKIYNDASKQPVTNNILLVLDRVIAEEGAVSGNQLIQLQSQLSPALYSLDEKSSDLSEFDRRIDYLEGNLSNIESNSLSVSSGIINSKSSMNRVISDLSSLSSQLSSFSTDLSEMSVSISSLSAYHANINNYLSRISLLISDSYSQESERNVQVTKINNAISKINSYDTRLYSLYVDVYNVRLGLGPSNPFYNDLVDMENEISSIRNDLYQTRLDLIDAKNKLNSLDFQGYRNELNTLYSELSITGNDLSSFQNNAYSKVDSLNTNLITARSNLGRVEGDSSSLKSSIDGFSSFNDVILSFVRSMKTDMDSLKDGVRDTQDLLSDLKSPIGSFVTKSRAEISPPSIESENVFSRNDKITILFPVIIGIDVLLASLLLPMIMTIRLKEQGILDRLKMSRISSFSVVFGRFLGSYLISLLQVVLISIVGIFIFKVYFSNIFALLFVILFAPVMFTSIGILLSQFVNRTSTAFLLSLLISVPLIFLSGNIVPLEFLNPPMDFIGSILPLHILTDVIEKLLFRGLDIFNSLAGIIYTMAISFISLFLSVVFFKFRS